MSGLKVAFFANLPNNNLCLKSKTSVTIVTGGSPNYNLNTKKWST